MKNKALLITFTLLALAATISLQAQENPARENYRKIGFTFDPETDFNMVGAGAGIGSYDGIKGPKTITANLASRWFYLSGDWTTKIRIDSFHAGPRVLAARHVTKGGTIIYLPVYAVVGITQLQETGGLLDYGGAAGLAFGRNREGKKLGFGITARITHETRAIALNVAF